MPTVEWVNARGVKMIKHYTYDKGGVSKANARAKSLREQGLKPKVVHKTGVGYRNLGGSKMKKVGNPFDGHTRKDRKLHIRDILKSQKIIYKEMKYHLR